MLSLTDELTKFEKITYENNLDGVITVEDNFSNGSVTIRDLVKENHVIISEFKRMKNVFINYTKINQKIYDKITEHELTFGSSILKLGHMTNFFEKTIEGTLDQMKRIYEDTVHQNVLSGAALDQKLRPLQEQLKHKVDMSMLRQVMAAAGEDDQHEFVGNRGIMPTGIEEEPQYTEFKHPSHIQQHHLDAFRPKSRKNTRNISEEELSNIKMEVTQQLNKLRHANDERVSEVYAKIQENMKANIAMNEQSYRQTYSKISQLWTATSAEQAKTKESLQTLASMLESKTNQTVWESHKHSILEEMRHKIGPILDQLDNLSKGYNQMGNDLRKSMQAGHEELLQEIHKTKKKFSENIQQVLQKVSKNHSSTNHKLEQTNRIHKDFRDHTQRAMAETAKIISNHRQQAMTELFDLRATIESLTATIQSSVLKLVVRRFTETISSLVAQVRDLKKAQAENSKKVSIAFQNINDIKQVISKKANYNDIINLFEKKASKQEVVVLKDMISTEICPRKEDSLGQGLNIRRNKRLGESSRLKTSIVRTSNKQSPDRSLCTSLTVGFSSDKVTNPSQFISKRFQLRPSTAAELSIFN